jgi:hypothetical protein
LLLLLLLLLCHTSKLHCSHEQWRDPPLFARSGSRPSKKKSKKYFQKFVIFSRVFLSILINIGLYFYTIKIRIWY